MTRACDASSGSDPAAAENRASRGLSDSRSILVVHGTPKGIAFPPDPSDPPSRGCSFPASTTATSCQVGGAGGIGGYGRISILRFRMLTQDLHVEIVAVGRTRKMLGTRRLAFPPWGPRPQVSASSPSSKSAFPAPHAPGRVGGRGGDTFPSNL